MWGRRLIDFYSLFVMTYPIEKLIDLYIACNADANQWSVVTRQIRRQMTIEEAQSISKQYS